MRKISLRTIYISNRIIINIISIILAFDNKTEKDIRAFIGSISIRDLFDTEIKSFSLTIDDPIPAGNIQKRIYATEYNQFMDEDVRLKNKDMDDLKVIWTPKKIIFTDGTTLE